MSSHSIEVRVSNNRIKKPNVQAFALGREGIGFIVDVFGVVLIQSDYFTTKPDSGALCHRDGAIEFGVVIKM